MCVSKVSGLPQVVADLVLLPQVLQDIIVRGRLRIAVQGIHGVLTIAHSETASNLSRCRCRCRRRECRHAKSGASKQAKANEHRETR